jgi:hypothetical protein
MPTRQEKRLRALAVEAFAVAAQMTDPECRRMMMGVAACYERLADNAAGRDATERPANTDGDREDH